MATNHLDKHKFAAGLQTKLDVSNVTTPTAAELIAAYGTAASVGAGFIALQDDNNADTAVKLICSNGTSYYFVALTKAV